VWRFLPVLEILLWVETLKQRESAGGETWKRGNKLPDAGFSFTSREKKIFTCISNRFLHAKERRTLQLRVIHGGGVDAPGGGDSQSTGRRELDR
jgi:hypothetical protein